MPRKAIKIIISKRVEGLLTSSINKQNIESHFKKRMAIIYMSSLGHENQVIAEEISCSPVTARKWRKKWKTYERVIEQTEI